MTLIVLGYTVNPDQSVHPVLKKRLDKSLELYKSGCKIVVCGKGTPKAFLPNNTSHKTEAEAMRDYLLDQGIPKESILLENKSMSTLTNAYYSYIDCVSKLEKKTSISVITNEFHIPSVKYCFHLIYGENYQIDYISCSNEGLDEPTLSIWKKRIQRMVEEAYPILFKEISPGDIESITKIVHEASDPRPTQKRLAFEAKLAEIAEIKDVQNLKGVI